MTASKFTLKRVRTILLWCLVVPILFAPVSGSAQSAQEAEVKKMARLFQRGLVSAALTQAKSLLAPSARLRNRVLRGRVYFYLGIIFYNQKKKLMARRAFEKALSNNPELRLQTGSPPALRRFVEKVRKEWSLRVRFRSSLVLRASAPPPAVNTSLLLAWVTAGVALVGLTAGLVAGSNAVNTSSQASSLLKSSHENQWNEPLVSPTINSLNQQAIGQSVFANVMFGVAGAAAAGSVTLFVLSSLNSKPGGLAGRVEKTPPLANGAFVQIAKGAVQ